MSDAASRTELDPPLDFDPDALREKYRVERDKRLRPDGNAQYTRIEGTLSHYVEDPYVDGPRARGPLTDSVEILIIGGGFGGLLTGARLREAGFEDIRMLEHGGDFGGTWYWNRYPGAACDTEAYIYLPLCEELGYVPDHKFAFQPEILEHARAIGRHYDLYRDACFQTAVTDLEWDAADARWVVRTNQGDAMRARFVIMSNGPLNTPKLPGIPGIEDFRGHTFHTSRWDYAYTGGGPEGGLDRLGDTRVAVIGTGATAVQCVPHLGAAAKSLHVFQRTPSSIDVRANRPTDPAWAASLHPGWQRERMENFNILTTGGIVEQDLVMDGWTEIIRNLISMANFRGTDIPREEVPRLMELADFRKMNQIRARVDAIVEDPATAEALKPWYRQFCKRPCFHDEYLPTFNRPNVHLVDTDGRGVERITERGIVANGTEYAVDCIVFATGFEVGTAFTHRAGYDITGRDGLKLSEAWADGMRSLHGLFVHGFPNLMITSNAQSGFTTNFPHAMDERARHMAYILDRCRDEGTTRIEATAEAQDAWVEQILSVARFSEDFQAACTPGYYNNEGQPNRSSVQNGAYGKGPVKFFRILDQWREAGDLAGLDRHP
ncbi:MAG: NAD(P)/FAD-dependent oxidoreductase [Pseudomonadales bacterium]|jgi:cyclohexanone monooxygenase|nr:NAD(P)/FAD-dependent oxidoreductase [Pseudomonadales bacterium]